MRLMDFTLQVDKKSRHKYTLVFFVSRRRLGLGRYVIHASNRIPAA